MPIRPVSPIRPADVTGNRYDFKPYEYRYWCAMDHLAQFKSLSVQVNIALQVQDLVPFSSTLGHLELPEDRVEREPPAFRQRSTVEGEKQ